MRRAAECLHDLGARAVVVKGGHLEGNETLELLSQMESSESSPSDREPVLQRRVRAARALTWEFPGPKLDSRATHGTGCAFASALACNLALGQPLPDSVGAAKKYVAEAIAHAYPLGRGQGPMNHLFRGVR
jgi:hydroxymethylpyrimidine/phosphomethylpyrimidine kinase